MEFGKELGSGFWFSKSASLWKSGGLFWTPLFDKNYYENESYIELNILEEENYSLVYGNNILEFTMYLFATSLLITSQDEEL